MLTQEIYSVIGFIAITGLGFLSNFFLHRLDVHPLKVENVEHNFGRFIAERAYQDLKTLNNFGPKVVGSDANEVQAFNYIFNGMLDVKKASENYSSITVDHQVVSGFSFQSSIYKNLQNIVVRVQGQTDNALLLNCHFDSVPNSPGASDDTVMCCVMMEIIRTLSKSKEIHKHSVVFLFNGSEEEDLQAAHGFITQHRWAKDVKAYINLESTGSGGREILFRSGPKHDWLIKLYRQSVPRPFGQAVAEELFETGVIPGATDFQIFRDYGNIPGFDFAYVKDGYRYHTRYDSIDYIPMETVQNTGENILELTKKMANSDELADPPEGNLAVYFDCLGLFFISYSKPVGVVINITIGILSFILPLIVQMKVKLKNLKLVIVETLISFLTVIVSTALSAGICYLLALIMNAVDNTMSWFNTIFLSIGIYGSLAVLIQIATYHLIQLLTDKYVNFQEIKEEVSAQKSRRLWIHLNGITLFWTCLTIVATALGYRFGYILMIILLFALCTNILIFMQLQFLPKLRTHSWIILHFIGHTFSFLVICYCMLQVWGLFIPITAKDYYSNPDTIIALICVLWSVLCLSYFIPLTTLIRRRAILYSMLITLFVVSLILSYTSVGFPYSDAKSAPRLQRFRFIHTRRTFYDHSGVQTFTENGFMLSAVDRNAIRTLESSFNPNEMIEWRDDPKCSEATYCGFPMYRFNKGNYLKGTFDSPTVNPTKFTLISTSRDTNISSNVLITFKLELTTLTMIYVTPGDGWTFVEGSMPVSHRVWNGKLFQFSKITYGKAGNEMMEETIKLAESPGADPLNVATISIATVESVFTKSSDYTQLMEKFPEWTFVMEQQADVSSFVIKEDQI